MSALATLARAAVSGVWKIAAVALLVLLLVVAVGAGAAYWLVAGERDQAQAALDLERGVSAGLRFDVDRQNEAVDQLAAAQVAAEERGAAAQALATANGKRFDGALAKLSRGGASTCAEAMPLVNQLLEDVR